MIKNLGFTNARLSARVAAVVGGAALSLVSTMSMAAIVDSGVVNLAIPATIDGIYLNVVTNGTTTTSPGVAGWDLNAYVTGGNLTFFTSTGAANNNQIVGAAAPAGATLLAAGAVIGPASAYAAAGVVTAPAFRVASTTSYLGVRFTNEATSTLNYGYIQLTTTAGTGTPAVITRYVYENAGAAITIPGGGPANTAPTLAYTPTTAAGVTFPGGAAGAATSSIAIAASGAAGTGNTTVTACAISGAGAAAFGAPTVTPSTFNTATTAGTIGLSCTRAAAAATASLACTETPTPGTVATRTWTLNCPAATVASVVTPATATGTPSPLPSYNLPTGSSFRDFVFTAAGAGTTLTCSIGGTKNFVVSPASLPLVVGTPGSVRVTYTGSVAGSFGVGSSLNCSTTGNAQTFTYPLSVVVGAAPVAVAVIPVPTLSFMGSLMLLAGFLGLGMFMANRRA